MTVLQFTLLAVKLPQFVHFLLHCVRNAFSSNQTEMSTKRLLIFTHKIILLSAAQCNPYPKNVFLYVHTTPQHTTAQHTTTITAHSSTLRGDTNSTVLQISVTSIEKTQLSHLNPRQRKIQLQCCAIANIFIEI